MPKAVLNGVTLAESESTEVVEGNHCFPPGLVNREHFEESATHTYCPWKGDVSYYSLKVDGTTVEDGARYYPQPKDAASHIRDHVAYYPGKVQIEN